MDYGFTHQGKVYTPNGTTVAAADNDARNREIEAAELARWAAKPDRMLAYYCFPAEDASQPKPYRREFFPALAGAIVTTRPGTKIGVIVSAKVYTHNFGGRFVALSVKGTNGAIYYGRTSWARSSCVNLRRAK